MNIKAISIIAAAMALSATATAGQKPSVNTMSACQATLDFVVAKTTSLESKYGGADVETVTSAFTAYRDFIQSEFITPGLLEFNGGDKAKADAMQVQVEEYQVQLNAAMTQKFKGDRLYTDQAMEINACFSQGPNAAAQDEMKAGLLTMIKLAKMK